MSAVDRARSVLVERARALAQSVETIPPMTCIEAGTERSYGDVVPAGLLLAGMRAVAAGDDSLGAVTDHLANWVGQRRTELGFPFHTGTLPTATDTVLTLVGYRDPVLVERLGRFAAPDGGVVPQLVGRDAGHMVPSAALAHWEPADDLTTALTFHLRAEAGLTALTAGSWFADRVEERASVFVGCPWVVDWAWALAARSVRDPAGIALRQRLARELYASANADGSFGRSDESPLATAAATAAAAALGDAMAEGVVETARHRLAEMVLAGTEPQVPFVSSQRCLVAGDPIAGAPPRFGHVMLAAGKQGLATPGDEVHLLARYRDESDAVLTGLALLSLAAPAGDRSPRGEPVPSEEPHPRYRCDSLQDYVAQFALPPALDRARRQAGDRERERHHLS